MPQPVTVFWFRRDLRLHDNAGLYHALKSGHPVVPLFIFDRHILDVLEDEDDARVMFLQDTVAHLQRELRDKGAPMEVHYGTPRKVWEALLDKYDVAEAHTNRDYEAYAKTRDAEIDALLRDAGATGLHGHKDHVIFEADEVQKKAGGHYTVFTPYSRQWMARLDTRPDEDANGEAVSFFLKPYPCGRYEGAYAKTADYGTGADCPTLADMGFGESDHPVPPTTPERALIERYDETRDIPGIEGTSRLGPHFRHGTVSIRQWARRAMELNDTFLSELIWRDFYSQVLQVHPRVITESFRPEYDQIEWRNDEADFEAWCEGRTGYALVDAGMRQLNSIGYMHNRVRMLTASFLTKHLLIDWRWGERYFARKLLDYDLASNNGGWQWAAGSGTDASPYFRVFNPMTQLKKFDKDLAYVREYVPEYGTDAYPDPIVDHKEARERALRVYKEGLARARAEGSR